jgi:DNA mismatch repair protein MutS2
MPPAAEDPSLDKAALDLEWATLVDRIAGRCVSEPGARRVRALAPAATLGEARRRAELTRDATALLAGGAPIPVTAVPDLEEPLERLARGGGVSGAELRDIRRLLDAARALRSFLALHGADHPALASTLGTDRKLDGLQAELAEAIGDDGEVLDRASPALARARRKVAETRRELIARLGELMNRYGDVLQDRFYTERDGRYVLPVRADAPFRVDGIVFGSSASGGTLYVEPKEITEISNRRHVAVAEAEREVARVLGALSISARALVEPLRVAREAALTADVLMALARWGSSADATVVIVDDSSSIDLLAARHPLLVGGPIAVVASDLRLAAGRGLVISGPNAGGKTVALKCLGLAVWMARAGIPIPTDPRSRLGWFDPVLTDIGDEQSLARSLSTFSAHAARLGSYLAGAHPGTLVLLDEVAAGTDPNEGEALAVAVLERLVTKGAAVAVTTHYERLKLLATRDARFENASVGFDFETMSPTFRVTLGVPGASSALSVASRYGIPEDVLVRARELIPEENLRRDVLLAEAETDRARAEVERRAAEADAREQATLRTELEGEVRRAREQERARLVREGNELALAVKDARRRLESAALRLQKADLDRSHLREIENDVNAAGREVALGSRLETALRKDAPSGAAPLESTTRLSPGDTVFVPKLRTHAEVLEAPSRGQVRVAAGSMKLTVRVDELTRAAPGARPPPVKASKKPRVNIPPVRHDEEPVRTESTTCDVRGLRVEEAIDRVDAFVDRLLGSGDPAGFILHGHGTGALKSALRDHLALHPCVARARAAESDQGGDAFTVLWTAG